MKKLAFLFALLISTSVLFAQNSKIQSAINYSKPQYNQLDKAKEAIDAAIVHEKTMNTAKAWKVRAEVYQAIAQSKDEKFIALSENPLGVAMDSYIKAIELDVKNKYKSEITPKLQYLGIMFINKGVDYFGTEEFDKALISFENSLKIDGIVEPTKIDSAVVFNSAIAADRAKNIEKAIYYYTKTTEIGYEGAKVFGFIANIHKENGDTIAYVETLQKGIGQYPGDIGIIFELINYYLDADQSDAALEYIAKAIEKDPSNQTLYFARGAIYDKKGEMAKAIAAYEKAVEINTDYFDAYYNLGALYFNKGADMLKEANNIPANEQEKYNAAVKEAFKELEKALPSLEKAHEIQPTEKSTLITLKEIYFKIRNDKEEYMANYKKYNEMIKALPEE